ncbi:hypothetical protein CEV33_2938 [Brucella grignonensis]|uniref:Uncharacterized protein n=2 Tax=Brucella grignonensis TaxID=94627 RepID=A0A256F2W6_9HYPH|nr:hypothetical protein CEV33_2938 [Brucella grignonensis]
MCKSPVGVLGLDELLASHGITGHAAAILCAVWSGRGSGITAERIFDAMYADDPEGGPAVTTIYRYLWAGLGDLDRLLAGSGVRISYSKQSASGRFKLRLKGIKHER